MNDCSAPATAQTNTEHDALDSIAVVGIAGRFPGAPTIRDFWENLVKGVTSIRSFTDEELEDSFGPDVRGAENFHRFRSILDDVDKFDAPFFGMQPREAALTDPQQRIFLELCWQALEDAGHDPARFKGAIGVFAGSSLNTYLLRNVLSDRAAVEQFTSNLQLGMYSELLGALHDFVATRVAYKLGLTGPAIAMQTACSTSLTAIAEACKSLLLFESDMALAGGVSVTFPQKRGYLHVEGGMASADGTCRPFDADACGTVFGDGAGVVVLKRLEDAVADHDHVYAVIRGWALNNDGNSKIGFTAPSVEGQARVIAAAHAMAGVEASSIGYVECHGTATPLGDPIEYTGLLGAFTSQSGDAIPAGSCVLGSVKANIGHLDAAAGVTGLIKAALVLHHGVIPPLANYRKPNPNIDLSGGPFTINSKLRPWPRSATVRRCGVSAFGVGGTNCHIVLEEAPAPTAALVSEPAKPCILALSARTPAALSARTSDLAVLLGAADAPSVADTAFTLVYGRAAFKNRVAVACRTRSEAVEHLKQAASSTTSPENRPPVIFLFPGQGAQRPGMGRELIENDPIVRAVVDRGLAVAGPVLGRELRDYLTGVQAPGDEADANATRLAQPALFLLEFGLAERWKALGATPSALIGHSLGEFTAAAVAGVMSFEEALKLVISRGALMQSQPAGAMMAVRASEAQLRPKLVMGVDIAAINGPALCTIAGSFEAIAQMEKVLTAAGLQARPLKTSHAFHSSMMDACIAPLENLAGCVRLNAPGIEVISTVTGECLVAETATSAKYWARHSRLPVRFSDAARTARRKFPGAVFLEVGPGTALGTFVAQASTEIVPRAILASLGDGDTLTDEAAIASSAARLWSEGIDIDLAHFVPAAAQRASLPGYPFERTRHWIDLPAPAPAAVLAVGASSGPAPTPANSIPPSSLSPSAQSEPPMLDTSSVRETEIIALLEDLTGNQLAGVSTDATFIELGFDSLFLGQVAQRVQKQFKVKVTFRQLMREYPTIKALAALLPAAPAELSPPRPAAATAASLPPAVSPQIASAVATAAPTPAITAAPMLALPEASAAHRIISEQLATMQSIFSQQLQLVGASAAPALTQAAVASHATIPAAPPATAPAPTLPAASAQATAQPAAAPPSPSPSVNVLIENLGASRFQVYKPSAASSGDATEAQQRFIDDLIEKTQNKSPRAKSHVQSNRARLADPRTASGFRAEWKEMVFPVVAARAKGSKIWDIDGNVYVDLVNGYGQTMFGHSPDFVTEALQAQLGDGFPIGPQSPLAGEVAQLFSEMTGHERVTFCNTGSEAVMAAMRVARTVTGRDKIVSFSGDYHGQFDEVLVKGAIKGGQPAAATVCPGIPDQSVANMVVLPYGQSESLDWIAANIDDIAAVMVEPVQSRHPHLQPVEFLRRLREITATGGTALVMDEIVTGFRVHPGGAQARFGIIGDLATYGKVVGGGMPIGVLAGKAAFMDALDGGYWSYGDDSVPEIAPTFFAGTFVRHPLVLAAARAVLLHLKKEGAALQQNLESNTSKLAARLNAEIGARGIKSTIEQCSSWFYFSFATESRLASLFYAHMRLQGVHIQEGFPCFLTTAHDATDIAFVEACFIKSLDALQAAGILGTTPASATKPLVASPFAATASAAAAAPVESPLTESQQEIYLIAQLGDAPSCVYNESISLLFEGDLDIAALRRAVDDVIQHHDALRARFDAIGEKMTIDPPLHIDIPVVDVSSRADPAAAVAAYLDSDARLPFDLEAGPLVRASLISKSATAHVLVLTAHHLVCDGWSMSIVIDGLQACYNAHRRGDAPDLEPTGSFAEYARKHAAGRIADAKTTAYWLGEFKQVPPPVELPGDRPAPRDRTYAGASVADHIGQDLYRQLKQTSAKQGCTLFMMLFASVQVLLGRLSGQSDVVIGIPTGGQALLDEPNLVGHCVNFLPMRAAFEPQEPFSQHLARAREKVQSAFDHQDYTLGTLMRGLDAASGRTQPLTSVQFNLEKIGGRLAFDGVQAQMVPNAKSAVYFDLFFNMIESDEGIRIDVDYSTEMFDETTVRRWISHLKTMLAGIAERPDQNIDRLPMLTASERRWIIQDLNATAAVYPEQKLTHELIEEHAERTPDAIAAIYEDRQLTYRQLDDAANRVAARLRLRVPQAGGQRIGVVMDRSLELLVALTAIWKAGHAYLPLDPTHPTARLLETLTLGEVAAVFCSRPEHVSVAPAGIPVLGPEVFGLVAMPNDPQLQPSYRGDPTTSTAYLIFTSGSTGKPKGVEITHQNLVNLFTSMQKAPGFTPRDRMLAVSTIAFDVAQGECFLPLVSGGVVELAPTDEVKSGFGVVKRIADPRTTVMHAIPTLWQMLVEAGFTPRPGLKTMSSGEPMPRDLANKLVKDGCEYWNLYGPTETTIWSSGLRVADDGTPLSIGPPLANIQQIVLDDHLEVAPPGVAGNLWIGGACLAKGYFRRPDLTEKSFRMVELDDRGPHRFYDSGDIGRLRGDGSIVLLGRRDHQVKLSGYRIELQEIESVMRGHPAVADAAVALRRFDDGDARLAAFFVQRRGTNCTPADLSGYLADKLPVYMVPTLWRQLDALPLSSNGKLDRKALPAVDRSETIAQPRQEPRQALLPVEPPSPAAPVAAVTPLKVSAVEQSNLTKTEQHIQAIWSEVLGNADMRTDQPLLTLGAQSLHIFRIVARMQKQGLKVNARQLMANPTIAHLASLLGDASSTIQPVKAAPSLDKFKRTPRPQEAQR